MQCLTGLAVLDLGSNSIVDVSPLSGLTNLTFLSLARNSIGGQNVGNVDTLVTLVNITTSMYLGLGANNGMSCGELRTLITTLNVGGNTPASAIPTGISQNCTAP